MSPSDIRARIALLELERQAADAAGLEHDLYRTELQAEVAAYRHAWVVATVTEIAALGGAFHGRSYG